MNTISSLSGPIDVQAGSPKVSTQSVSSGFSSTFSGVHLDGTWLTSEDASRKCRPNVKEFMDSTGATFAVAAELLYGVVGSNTDVRDWKAIMASNDPVTTARQATMRMYSRTDVPQRADATYIGCRDTVTREGKFAITRFGYESHTAVDEGVKLVDAQGQLLRDAGINPESIARNAWLFGFDTQPLERLAQEGQKVSETLGVAIEQASASLLQAGEDLMTPQRSALSGAANASHTTGRNGIDLIRPPTTREPDLLRRDDSQGNAPALEETIVDSAVSALSYVDTVTYLDSLFKK